ncbi:membrane dipeptidase-domain-containing protein [Lactarius vividus]|nr:membrane dipeptidase-domain-containing protein [Lactarius vividus]
MFKRVLYDFEQAHRSAVACALCVWYGNKPTVVDLSKALTYLDTSTFLVCARDIWVVFWHPHILQKYTSELALTPRDVIGAVRRGKISALIGIEGAYKGHQLGNSLGTLRQFAALGVRYVTLTHTCHNVLADSSGLFDGSEPLHHGLSLLSGTLVREFNRLGGLSHTSDDTALAALKISRAPVI